MKPERLSSEPCSRLEPTALGNAVANLATLDNSRGVRVRLLSYGATVVSMECPDRDDRVQNVVLGFRNLERYLGDHPYFGATVGRFANRIRNGRFRLDGREVCLAPNENGHQLHGGRLGFHRAVYETELLRGADHVGVAFSRTSPDGEEGFPGNLRVRVEYRLFESALAIDFTAKTDRPTVVNLSHHGYWNLSGGARSVREHVLWIASDRYVPLDAQGIPSVGTRPVEGTPFDFRQPRRIGERLEHPDLASRHGYDHPFMVRTRRGEPAHVATLSDPPSGRRLDVLTTEPVLHLYTGQLLDPETTGYDPFSALCLETGQAADCPNQPGLGSAQLMPGQHYEHTVVYRLAVEP